MKSIRLFSIRCIPAYASIFFPILTAILSQFAIPGPLRFLPPFFLILSFSSALISLFFGSPATKAAGLAAIAALTWAAFNTQSIGNIGLFLIASGAWFWLGGPLTILAAVAFSYFNKPARPQ